MDENRVILRGKLIEMDALRYTPAGVPVVKFRIAHESSQTEAGTPRQVGCELPGVAFETEAKLLAGAPLGAELSVTGFLDRRGKSSRSVVLHATHIDFK